MLFSSERSESLLYMYFHEFYSEVVRIKQQIKSGGIQGDDDDAKMVASVTPSYIQQQLVPILERQRADASHRGGEYGAALYSETQYLMAGLVDEIFLHIVKWDGVDIWNNNLLETRLFDSYIAGEQIFRNLDKLLQERNPVYADLARIYLIALSLGFQGKHRNMSDTQQLDDYRQQLFKFISQREPEGLYENLQFNEDKHIFPQAYANTIKENNTQALPSLRPWFLALMLVSLTVFIGSNYFWHRYTDSIQQRVNDILLDRSLNINLEQDAQGD